MAIPRKIRRRAAEAVLLFLQADPDFFALGGGRGEVGEPDYRPPRMFLGPYSELKPSVTMTPLPRQYHVYNGDSVKEPGTGTAWDRAFSVTVECYSPVGEKVSELGGPADVDDELDELGDRLFLGESPNGGPGRFRDPDDPERFITLGIAGIDINQPAIAHDRSAMLRRLTVRFLTRENAEGDRV